MSDQTPLLELRGVRKVFPGVIALDGVDFDLRAGEAHALLGENGAGKSTLIKVLTGAYQKDAGEMLLNGVLIAPASPAEAQALGVSAVYQEVNLLPNLSVAHNLFLGREPQKFGCIDWKEINRRSRALLARFELDIDVRKSMSSYSVAVRQLVAIARGVSLSAKVLILDEPTASLDADEVGLLFRILQQLKQDGVGVIFITHFLDQAYALSDRITVLRNGAKVGTFETATLPRTTLVEHMLGREFEAMTARAPEERRDDGAALVLEVENLSSATLADVSLSVPKGRAVGLAGLLGAGRTRTCSAIFGVDRKHGGAVRMNGKNATIKNPGDAIRLRMAFCPEDRKDAGIVGPLSLRENIALALLARRGWLRPMTRKAQRALAEKAVKDLRIAASDIEKPVEQLSGGNQQKAILGRWLATQPELLILDEPTRGIDVGAHAEILKLIRRLCDEGMALLVASSELEEIVAFSDSVVVLRDRKKAADLSGADVTEDNIMAAIAQS